MQKRPDFPHQPLSDRNTSHAQFVIRIQEDNTPTCAGSRVEQTVFKSPFTTEIHKTHPAAFISNISTYDYSQMLVG